MKNDPSILQVCDKPCDQCLYGPNKIVSDARKAEIENALAESADYFICHKSSIVGEKVMCRGYYNRHKESSLLIRLGRRLNTIVFTDVMEIMRNGIAKHRKKVNHD